jgi:hypothetical protein
LPMLLSADIDAREISSLSAEVIEICQQIFGARNVRVWQYPLRMSSTFFYYVLSLLSDKYTPGQGFCGIRMWFPRLTKDSYSSNLFKVLVDLSGAMPDNEIHHAIENARVVSISFWEAVAPYLGIVLHKGYLAVRELGATIMTDDSDVATETSLLLHGDVEGEGEGEGESDDARQRLEGTTRRSGAADRVSYSSSVQKWLYEFSVSLRRSQSDPQYRWTAGVLSHLHLLFFLWYGVYASPVLRVHAVRLIDAIRVSKTATSGGSIGPPPKGVAGRINLKALSWVVGSRLALLALYGTYQAYITRSSSSSSAAAVAAATAEPLRVDGTSFRKYQTQLRASEPGAGADDGHPATGNPNPPPHPNEMPGRQCPLCMDSVKHPVATHCGHMYCHACLHDLLRRSGPNYLSSGGRGGSLCPVCRKDIKAQDLRNIYV